MDATQAPQLTRTKSGTSDDTDYAGQNDSIASIGVRGFPGSRDLTVGGLRSCWVCVLARDTNGVLLDRGTCSFTITPLEEFSRAGAVKGRGAGAAVAVVDQAPITGCALNRWYEIPLHACERLSFRISALASSPAGVTDFEIWTAPGN